VPPLTGAGYINTTFEDGLEETSAVGNHLVNGHYPVYIAFESKSTGFGNILLTATYDQGKTWSPPIQVNDNASTQVDEFQPNLAIAPDSTVSVNFYDRRLACPKAGTSEASAAGLTLDQSIPNYSGSLPPYDASGLLRQLERPVLCGGPAADRAQYPTDRAYLGPAAEQPPPACACPLTHSSVIASATTSPARSTTRPSSAPTTTAPTRRTTSNR